MPLSSYYESKKYFLSKNQQTDQIFTPQPAVQPVLGKGLLYNTQYGKSISRVTHTHMILNILKAVRVNQASVLTTFLIVRHCSITRFLKNDVPDRRGAGQGYHAR